MALVNHTKREVNAKIVYFGAPGSGKRTVLNYVYNRLRPELRGELKASPAAGEHLICIDFNPFGTALANGYSIRFHVYTLSGVVANPAAWKMTLKGADGLVLMLDAGPGRTDGARECIAQLREYLGAYGMGLQTIPCVLQVQSGAVEADEPSRIADDLGLPGLEVFPADVSSGRGILETLNVISRRIMEQVGALVALPADAAAESAPEDSGAGQKVSDRDHRADMPVAAVDNGADDMQIVVARDEIRVEGDNVLIPLDLGPEHARRRMVVTVTVALEPA